jgi:hypothetical protein
MKKKWFKSSYSGSSNACVEIAVTDTVYIRDTKNPDGTWLHVSPDAWGSFVKNLPERKPR